MSNKKIGKFEFQQEASLSQQLSNQIPLFQRLAGCDTETSQSIAVLEALGKHGFLDINDPGMKLILDLLNVQRMAKFATSDTVNEITKMGLMLPKSKVEIDFKEGEE